MFKINVEPKYGFKKGGKKNMKIDIRNVFKASATGKMLSVLVVLLMLGTAASVFVRGEGESVLSESLNFSFSAPVVEVDDTSGYATIKVDDLLTGGTPRAPELPYKPWEILLPLGAKVLSVDFTYDGLDRLSFHGVVKPVATPMPLLMPDDPLWSRIKIPSDPTDDNVYTDKPYGSRFSYEVTIGQINGELKTIVSGKILPVVLSSVIDEDGDCIGEYIRSARVTVTYTLRSSSAGSTSDPSFDLLILAPKGYVKDLVPLVKHKKSMGVNTKLVSLDEVYSETYFDIPDKVPGTYKPFRDNQERIKYFIYQAILK